VSASNTCEASKLPDDSVSALKGSRLGPALRAGDPPFPMPKGVTPSKSEDSKRRMTLQHYLHVLLRHHLLRKPGGFEGFGLGLVHFESRHLPVTERDQLDQRELDRESRMPGPPTEPKGNDQVVASVDELRRLEPSFAERFRLGADDLENAVPATVRARPAIRKDSTWLEHDVRIKVRLQNRLKERGIAGSIRLVQRRVAAASPLDILLRHRPRSISRGEGRERAVCQAHSAQRFEYASCRMPSAFCGSIKGRISISEKGVKGFSAIRR
jgi:hypothetical protein